MARYPIYSEYFDEFGSVWRSNPLQAESKKELIDTVKQLMSQGDRIISVHKINRYGEFVPYDWIKNLKIKTGGGNYYNE